MVTHKFSFKSAAITSSVLLAMSTISSCGGGGSGGTSGAEAGTPTPTPTPTPTNSFILDDDPNLNFVEIGVARRLTLGGRSLVRNSEGLIVSRHGRYVAVGSDSTVFQDPGNCPGLLDLVETSLVEIDDCGVFPEAISEISADGRFVLGRRSNPDQLIRYDYQSGVGEIIVEDFISSSTISADGQFVLFTSDERLVSIDSDDLDDVYLMDMNTGSLSLVSISTQGEISNKHSEGLSVTSGGRFVVFDSDATNLTNEFNRFTASNGQEFLEGVGTFQNPSNGPSTLGDITYLHDTLTGQTSVMPILTSANIRNHFGIGWVSEDGENVAYLSGQLGDGPGTGVLFERNLNTIRRLGSDSQFTAGFNVQFTTGATQFGNRGEFSEDLARYVFNQRPPFPEGLPEGYAFTVWRPLENSLNIFTLGGGFRFGDLAISGDGELIFARDDEDGLLVFRPEL